MLAVKYSLSRVLLLGNNDCYHSSSLPQWRIAKDDTIHQNTINPSNFSDNEPISNSIRLLPYIEEVIL